MHAARDEGTPTHAGHTGHVGFNPYRKYRAKPVDYLLITAVFGVALALVAWALLG